MKWCCCCSSICRVGNAVRLLHLLMTFSVFYVLLTAQHSDLYRAWKSKNGYFISLVCLLCVSLLLYLVASFKDPGYLPKPDLLSLATAPSPSSKHPDPSTIESSIELTLSLDLDPATESDMEVGSSSSYCRICRHHKPMRTKHCYVCGRCVKKFDHHCPWLGNCVGEGNHCYFWLFLAVETALLAWGVCISWSAISSPGSFQGWLRVNLLQFLCLVLTFLSVIIVGLLFLYHSYLSLSGQTTWEQASRSKIPYLRELKDLKNPFDEGCCCNVVRFMCSGLRDWDLVYFRTMSGGTKRESA